jgi:hypothetical protein
MQTYTLEQIEQQGNDNWMSDFGPADELFILEQVEAQKAEWERLARLADSGADCERCNIRQMALEGEQGYGQGLCEKCYDQAQELRG